MKKFMYVLNDDNNPVATDDIIAWDEFMKSKKRLFIQEVIRGVLISNVFLGIDHGFGFYGPPILFETMVFGGKFDLNQSRYVTYEEAMNGHADMMRRVLLEDIE